MFLLLELKGFGVALQMSTTTRVRLLRGSGLLLLLLGTVHLVATPHIATLIRHTVSKAAADWLVPPMLLNHVLVGVLLLPLGYLTFYAAPHSAPWALIIVRTTALTVAALPLTLLVLMGYVTSMHRSSSSVSFWSLPRQ